MIFPHVLRSGDLRDCLCGVEGIDVDRVGLALITKNLHMPPVEVANDGDLELMGLVHKVPLVEALLHPLEVV
jgi:hypothetical protein